MTGIYLDHSATTPVREEVLEAMTPFFAETFGNASSAHGFGQAARKAMLRARSTIAGILGASPDEIIFTSGGTEADNLAVLGVAHARGGKGGHIITSAIEHKAILNCCDHLGKHGYTITRVPVDAHGCVKPDDVATALRPDTILVSIMLANNEVGTIEPLAEIARITRARGVPLHTDAIQAAGKLSLNVDALGVDLLSISAHKICGPKGIGALYVRAGSRITPMMYGGHHEMNRRAGTENLPGMIGMARALELADAERPAFSTGTLALRDSIEKTLVDTIPETRVNGHPKNRLPNILNVSFRGVEAETLIIILDSKGIAVSTGSACTSGALDASHVLTAMKVPPEEIRGSVRLSLGRSTTRAEIDLTGTALREGVARIRQTAGASAS